MKNRSLKMTMKFAVLGYIVLLASCASYSDPPQPTEEQTAELTSATEFLRGKFDVVDSRKDDFQGTTQVNVGRWEKGVAVTLKNQKGGMWVIEGSKCSGHYSTKNASASLRCDVAQDGGVYWFMLSRREADDVVTSQGWFAPKPMIVPGESYLLQLFKHGGRDNSYVLKKQ